MDIKEIQEQAYIKGLREGMKRAVEERLPMLREIELPSAGVPARASTARPYGGMGMHARDCHVGADAPPRNDMYGNACEGEHSSPLRWGTGVPARASTARPYGDAEAVLGALYQCGVESDCQGCGYYTGYSDCYHRLMRDALAVIKGLLVGDGDGET